ncbi:hypothetical protein HJC23_009732 [Cyclotella cryptica]|uniref:cGMP-dependent protein kinase n=1 Tax=Cyclotella cryptica TaxID=29204 RepID=A0ABD3PQ96_9STRA
MNEMINLISSILSKKPLGADDIHSLNDARKELSRIRKLMQNYHDAQELNFTARRGKKVVRNAIQEEDYIKGYVKKTVPKSASIRKLIKDAIQRNELFDMNTEDELNEIVDIFEPCIYDEGDTVIKQGEHGNTFYVVENGELSVTVAVAPPGKDDKGSPVKESEFVNIVVGYLSEGTAFGELALIYESPRAATIKAMTKCKLWRVKRAWYRGLMGQHHKRLHEEKLAFLSDVGIGTKRFKDYFDRDQLDSIAQLMKQEHYPEGHVIIREGEEGDTFYMISSGSVNIFKKAMGDSCLGTIGRQKYFGEKALLSDDLRAATCIVASPLTCYVLARDDFTRVLGHLKDVFDGTAQERMTGVYATIARKNKVKYQLSDLNILNVLGRGGFGKVRLAKSKHTSKYYALKIQRKDAIVKNHQQDYVLREYKLLMELSHPNILAVHCAMQDSKYIYFLVDLLPGGELMNLLEHKGTFPEDWVQFYSASVLLAYGELHAQRIVYRDLKPENLVLDNDGYCVVIDFGLAKRCVGPTYTLCGTPDYIAPEVIQGVGYGIQVDFWALGVLMYELFEGETPFASYDPSSVAKKILQARFDFPRKMSLTMQDAIRCLLTRDPSRRLGCLRGGIDDVMKHRFFRGFDWDGLGNRTLAVPHVPKLPKNIEKLGSRELFSDHARDVDWVADLEHS